MATHSSIPACKIPWTGELGRLQFMWSLLISSVKSKYWKGVMLLIVASEFPHPPHSNFHSKAQALSATKIVSCFLLCDRFTLFVKKLSARYLHLN